MRRKYIQASIWLMAVMVAVSALTPAAAGLALQSWPVPNMFGFTLGDIYDTGVIVTNVEIGSRAAAVGILKDDVILGVNGIPIMGTGEFQRLIYELGGGPFVLTVSRFGEIRTIVLDAR
jgi:S1-C subfamily serine protease